MQDSRSILLFDGVCNLCNGFVNFIIDHDPEGKFSFASLQSETGKKYLQQFRMPQDEFASFVLIQDNTYYTRSTAALKVVKELKGGIWNWFYFLKILPKPLLDTMYNLIAKNRYKWFGKQEVCRMPGADLKSRFME